MMELVLNAEKLAEDVNQQLGSFIGRMDGMAGGERPDI